MRTCMICWWKLVSAMGRRGACGGDGVCCGDPSAPPPLSCAISAATKQTNVIQSTRQNIILQEQQNPMISIHCHNVRVCPQRHCRQAHVSRCGCAVCTRPYACDLNNLGWVGGRRGADLASHYSINTCFTVVKCFSVELGRVQLFA